MVKMANNLGQTSLKDLSGAGLPSSWVALPQSKSVVAEISSRNQRLIERQRMGENFGSHCNLQKSNGHKTKGGLIRSLGAGSRIRGR